MSTRRLSASLTLTVFGSLMITVLSAGVPAAVAQTYTDLHDFNASERDVLWHVQRGRNHLQHFLHRHVQDIAHHEHRGWTQSGSADCFIRQVDAVVRRRERRIAVASFTIGDDYLIDGS